MICRCFVVFVSFVSIVSAAGFSTPLRKMGYSLIPAPQNVRLTGDEVGIDNSWRLESDVGDDHIAVRRLRVGAARFHRLEFAGSGPGRVVLRVDPATVPAAGNAALAQQAYRLSIQDEQIEVTGNGDAGLFYGVQSLLQLLRPDGAGGRMLPAGVITDWPALELRFIHWDTKHHQDRLETLKRYIDWAAFFKVNAIGFEIEDKYEYPRHPIIGAPGAFTKQQMHELTAYALERYIQLVPQIQSPAHMAYVLKHEEFAHLRAEPECNYQVCMCDEEAMRLIEDMYQDMIDATPGVKYFHVSTDEVYYAGICDKCQAERPYNDENRSLRWVEFVNRMHAWLKERDRQMLCWVEYPLRAEHLNLLPGGLINGVLSSRQSDEWIRGLKDRGVWSLVYDSQQGDELLFPNYFSSDFLFRDRSVSGRLDTPAATVGATIATGADLLGTFAAAWDDSGLHDETFWLGWATVTQYGWTPEAPSVAQSVADFMEVFYGPGNQDMVEIYRTLMEGARFYESSLDRVPATRLKPSYGSWAEKGRGGVRIDFTLTPPALPFAYDEDIVTEDRFQRLYRAVLTQAPEMNRRLDQLIHALEGKLTSANRNRYNVEVLLSIARFEKHFVEMMLRLEEAEGVLLNASPAQRREKHADVLAALSRAHGIVNSILRDRAAIWSRLKQVWEESRHPKGQSVGGRHFVHVLDDLKDHRADRRAGLDYMLEPLENIGLEEWNKRLGDFRDWYQRVYDVP